MIGNTTITHRRPTHGTAVKSHRTRNVTRHEDRLSKATSSLFPITRIAKLDGHKLLNNTTRTKHRTHPHTQWESQ